MSKKINLIDKKGTEFEKEYTLEYTRRTVKEMQSEGFRINELGDKPLVVVPALFAGAFRAHHRRVKGDVIERILDEMPNKEKLIEILIEMYNDAEASLMDEPDEDAEKNVSWGVSE